METSTYKELAEKLQAPFPLGTVIETGKHQAYIPVQAYMARLEEIAAGQWQWRVIKEPIVYSNEQAVCVIGELVVAGTVRSGMGFSYYVNKEDAKSVSAFKNAVSGAESDAIRNACDKFLMGWKDLAQYREWASNPGVGLGQTQRTEEKDTGVRCIKCQNPLKSEDILFLDVNNIRNHYCKEHVPQHFLKKK